MHDTLCVGVCVGGVCMDGACMSDMDGEGMDGESGDGNLETADFSRDSTLASSSPPRVEREVCGQVSASWAFFSTVAPILRGLVLDRIEGTHSNGGEIGTEFSSGIR